VPRPAESADESAYETEFFEDTFARSDPRRHDGPLDQHQVSYNFTGRSLIRGWFGIPLFCCGGNDRAKENALRFRKFFFPVGQVTRGISAAAGNANRHSEPNGGFSVGSSWQRAHS